ncbi:MAG: Na/Pi cotransporter family protein [Lachnospiraceae bacterium]|nr:Na/Pi cotransporter family protein [Lachnospiraceae bacterium]
MFSTILTLLCGVALFLFGMQQMGDGLKKVAGNQLELTLYRLTNTPLKGLLLGTIVTAVIQSSSATTVMVVGFVNSGMMKVAQAIGIIMGANIGTSITGWILCLSYIDGDSGIAQILSTSTISGIMALVGICFLMMGKKTTTKNIGTIMMGFAVLMIGMQTMSGAVSPLKENESFVNMLTVFSNPFMGILFGIVFTAILQSASASVGILQALSVTGGITFATAFPITLGIGVGAAFPVLLSSIGTNKNGKRTAIIYLLNDLFGMVFWSIVFYTVNAFVHFDFLDMQMRPVTIALLNTVYRAATIAVIFPFVKGIEKLVYTLVKDDPEEEEEYADFELLEERFLDYPALAIQRSHQAIAGMLKKTEKNFTRALELMNVFSQEKYDKIQGRENLIDKYEDKLGAYIMKITARPLTSSQSSHTSQLLHSISDIERIGDHAVALADTAFELADKKYKYSSEARREIALLLEATTEIIDLTDKAFCDVDIDAAKSIEPLRMIIGEMCDLIKIHHIGRLKSGECQLKHSFSFNDILTNCERIAAHCSNVGIAMLEQENDSYDPHQYEKVLRDRNNEESHAKFEEYAEKYDLMKDAPPEVKKKKNKDKNKDKEKSKDKEKKSKDKSKDKEKSKGRDKDKEDETSTDAGEIEEVHE